MKQIIAGYTYGSFQDMFQKAVKIACIMSETEIKNRKKDQVKEEFGPGGSNSQRNTKFRRFKHGMKQGKGMQAAQWKLRELVNKPHEMRMQHYMTSSLGSICHTSHTCTD